MHPGSVSENIGARIKVEVAVSRLLLVDAQRMMSDACMLSSCLVVKAHRFETLLVGFFGVETSVTSFTGGHNGRHRKKITRRVSNV